MCNNIIITSIFSSFLFLHFMFVTTLWVGGAINPALFGAFAVCLITWIDGEQIDESKCTATPYIYQRTCRLSPACLSYRPVISKLNHFSQHLNCTVVIKHSLSPALKTCSFSTLWSTSCYGIYLIWCAAYLSGRWPPWPGRSVTQTQAGVQLLEPQSAASC